MRSRRLIRGPAFDIYLVECRFHESAFWVTEQERWPELVIPIAGGFLLRHADATAACQPGRLTLLPAGTAYEVGHIPHLPDRTLVFRFRALPEDLTGVLPFRSSPVHRLLPPRTALAVQVLAEALIGGSTDGDLPGRVLDLVRLALEGVEQGTLASGMAARIERALVAVAQEQVGGSVADLAASAASSDAHFARRFRDIHGITPGAFLTTRRLLCAWSSVREGTSMTEAARVAGFSHVAHLSHTLRRITGHPMTQLESMLEQAPWDTADRLLGQVARPV